MTTPTPGNGARWVAAVLCVGALAIPFAAVDFIPNTDLPQHLGQLRLLGEALSGASSELEIQWWTPYGLVYALMALPWLLLPPLLAGKTAVWLLAALQVAALHWVAASHRRPLAAAILASAFVFNSQFYWGFLNFQFGGVVFLGWLAWSARRGERAETSGPRVAVRYFVLALLLYASHALWFAFGMLWLAADAWIERPPRRELLWRLAGVAPVAGAACHWFLFLRSSSFSTPPEYYAGPLIRLRPDFFAAAGLGGIHHPIDGLVVLVAVLWIVAGGIAAWRGAPGSSDRRLAALALLLLAVYLLVPDKFSNTIRFSARWLPYCLMIGLLAVGELPLRRLLRRAVAVVVVATLLVVNVSYWRAFERQELAGLAGSLARLPPEPRVLGLSYLEGSPRIAGQPYIQLFAWSYALHGGDVSFSFGYFAPSLVVYKDQARVRWTWGLEWFPKWVRRSDFRHFDFTLVGGDEEAHARMAALPELEPLTEDGVWRLYRVVTASPPGPRPAD